MNLLEGKRGLILGVATERSIAWSIAKAAHAEGARLAFNYQNERLEERVMDLLQDMPDSRAMACDVSRDDQLDHLFEHVAEWFDGQLDFLIHSIAFAKKEDLRGRFIDTPRTGFALAMEVSVYSLVATARRAAPLMAEAGGGSIVTLSYLGAERVVPNYNVMGVAKAALEASVRYTAADLGGDGIRCNAISAGPIKTLAASAIGGFSRMLHHVETHAPLKRSVEVEEVAQAAVFLASDASRGVTGETLYVDGGYHIMM